VHLSLSGVNGRVRWCVHGCSLADQGTSLNMAMKPTCVCVCTFCYFLLYFDAFVLMAAYVGSTLALAMNRLPLLMSRLDRASRTANSTNVGF
jgi:hypothetical protein